MLSMKAPAWQHPLSVITLITSYFTSPFDVLHLIKVRGCVTNEWVIGKHLLNIPSALHHMWFVMG